MNTREKTLQPFDEDICFGENAGRLRCGDAFPLDGNPENEGAVNSSTKLDSESFRDFAAGYALCHRRIRRSGHAHAEPGHRPIRAECFVLERLRAEVTLVLHTGPCEQNYVQR